MRLDGQAGSDPSPMPRAIGMALLFARLFHCARREHNFPIAKITAVALERLEQTQDAIDHLALDA